MPDRYPGFHGVLEQGDEIGRSGHDGGMIEPGSTRSERQPQKEMFTVEPIAGRPEIYFQQERRARVQPGAFATLNQREAGKYGQKSVLSAEG